MANGLRLKSRTLMMKGVFLCALLSFGAAVLNVVMLIRNLDKLSGDGSRLASPDAVYFLFGFIFLAAVALLVFDTFRYCFGIKYGSVLPVGYAAAMAASVFNLAQDVIILFDEPERKDNIMLFIMTDSLMIFIFFTILLYYSGLIPKAAGVFFAAVNVAVSFVYVYICSKGGRILDVTFAWQYLFFTLLILLSTIEIKPVVKPVSDFERY